MTTSLFIGRFQPFHKGHLIVLKKFAQESKLLKIAIGSSQFQRTNDNPFSANERKVMIEEVLQSEKITNAKIYFIPDINDNGRWVEHVQKIVGDFDIVHSGNDLVVRLFKKKGMKVEIIDEIDPYKATRIREKVAQGGDVKNELPLPVYEYLKRINGFTIIKESF